MGKKTNKMEGINKQGANLTNANLRYSDLTSTNLRNADLRGADLKYSSLKHSDLTNSDLRNADLTYADLRNANLTGADLKNANLTYVYLTNANLTDAKNYYSFVASDTSNRIVHCVRHDKQWMVKAGCFWGTLEELEVEVKKSHNSNVYLANIEIIKNL